MILIKVIKIHIMRYKIENLSHDKIDCTDTFFCWFGRSSFAGQCGHKDTAIEMVT